MALHSGRHSSVFNRKMPKMSSVLLLLQLMASCAGSISYGRHTGTSGYLDVVYVSKTRGKAKLTAPCGSESTPCKTLQAGFQWLAWNGTLYVDGAHTDRDPYTCKQCKSSKKELKVQKSFTLLSYPNSIARISCPDGMSFEIPKRSASKKMSVHLRGVSFVESKQLWIRRGVEVVLESVSFNRTLLRLRDASAMIQGCSFRESSPAIDIIISNSLPTFYLKVKSTVFTKNCGCIEIKQQKKKAKGCNRKIVLEIQDTLFQENKILMKSQPKDRESGLVTMIGSKNCRCQGIHFSSSWINVTASNNQGTLEFCNKSHREKRQKCCWSRKRKPDFFTRSIFFVRACKLYLKFSKVKSWNNANTRFLAAKSRCNDIRVEKSSFHGHDIDNPGGVMRIKGKGEFVGLNIVDSNFVNNSGALGGVLQIDGGPDKVVELNMRNVSLLHSHGSVFGCIISVANFSYEHDSPWARVAQITAYFKGLSVNRTKFSYGPVRNKTEHYAAICIGASNHSHISIKNSLFYRNQVPALILNHKSVDTSPPSNSSANVKLEKTNLIENHCPPKNAILTVLVEPSVKKSNLTFFRTTFLKNQGTAVMAKKVLRVEATKLICRKNSKMCLFLESKKWPKDFSSVNSTLIIKDSIFYHNFNSAIKFKHTKPKFLDIQIINTIFIKNRYRAALNLEIGLRKRNNSLVSGSLLLSRSNFTSNSVDFASTHVLTCILMVPSKGKFKVKVDKTVFKDNFQNSKGNVPGVSSVFFFYVPEDFEHPRSSDKNKRKRCKKFPHFQYNRKMLFTDVVFENNTGSSSMLYVSNGAISFYRCLFKNSYARYAKSGAHVFVEEGTAGVSFFNTSFEQSKISNRKPGKDTPCKDSFLLPFIYAGARGRLIVKNTSFTLDVSERKSRMFTIQNGRYVHFDTKTTLRCPVGSYIKLENSSHVIQPMFTRDHCRLNITRMRFLCRMCPVSTYSLQRGSFLGLQNKTYIDCLSCPFGARCNWNIKSKKNFWGYLTSTDPPHLQFAICPDNYCRTPGSKSNTSVYNRCSGNRTGLLCGACREGYTESVFNDKCRPVSDCRDGWFWAIVGLYSVIMAIYIYFRPPIVMYLVEKVTWFRRKKTSIPNRRHEQTTITDEHGGHGYSKIIFYFYQVADLLMLESSSEILGEQACILTVISFYNFQVDTADSSFGCPFPGLTAVTKELFRSLQVFAVMVILVAFYFLHWLLWAISKRSKPQFAPYLAAIIEVLLLGYERLAHTSFNLLGCTPLKINGHVEWKMFLDGNITCWVHWWQYAMIAYNIVFVIPFLLVLLVGTPKLRRREISPFHFLAACFLPLPFLVYWMLKRLLDDEGRVLVTGEEQNQEYRKEFLEVIRGPFRSPTGQSKGALYWESILIGRRLVLLSLHSLVATPMLRLLSMTFICMLILLHDVMIKPFKDRRTNHLAVFLLFIHVVLGAINLAKASLINVGVAPKGPPEEQMNALQLLEIALLGILPCFFLLLVAASFISQAIRLIIKAVLYLFPKACLKKDDVRWSLKDSQQYSSDSYQPLLNPATLN